MFRVLANIQQQVDNIRGSGSAEDTIKNILNAAYFAFGIVAVAMIVLGGYWYLSSQGDASKVSKGKSTILYGIIGLLVVIMAAAITNFVFSSL